VNASRTKTGWWFKTFFAAGGRSLNGYFLPSISMAKTRATPTLRQRHIPPKVTNTDNMGKLFVTVFAFAPALKTNL
jgi:hypothetical protein